jgi:hypothetical protein
MAYLARAAEVGRSGDPAAFGTANEKAPALRRELLVEQINWLPGLATVLICCSQAKPVRRLALG